MTLWGAIEKRSHEPMYKTSKKNHNIEKLQFNSAQMYIFFRNKTDDYLYLYIRYLENSRLKPFFWYAIFICIYVGR